MKNLKFLFAFLVYFAVFSCSAVPSQKDNNKGELGLSISNPIKVNSVPDYDELKVQKPDGTTVSYFFDINSFYLDF